MNKFLLLLPALVAVLTFASTKPAYAWDKSWCQSGAAGKEAGNPAAGQEAIAWCEYNYPNSPVAVANTNNNTNTNTNNVAQHQGQHQSQAQNQSLNNRLTQNLSNSGNSANYNVIHVGAQLPMVNAPDCGGVNVGGTAGYDGGFTGAISAATHVGRRSDSCNHYDAPVQPAPTVYVQPAAAVAPVVLPAQTRTVIERRTVYVHEDRCPSHLTSFDAYKLASDLHKARMTKDRARIRHDRTALERACREDLVDTAIDGTANSPLGH